MREHLYRGKTRGSGEWVYGYYCKYSKHIDKIHCVDKYGYAYMQIDIDLITLCEYTNLTDSKGNKIFEGDILQEFYGNKYNILGFVEFGEGTFDSGIYRYTGFYFKEKDGNIDHTNLHPKLIKEYNIEVIGNIYDNPELLKGE